MEGTHKNTFMGLDPTDKPVAISGFDIFRIDDGVVAERWGTLDGLTLMQQMDVLMPEGVAIYAARCARPRGT